MKIFQKFFNPTTAKTAEAVTATADQSSNPKPKYAPEIEQIHREFETAGERILIQAQTVLKEAENAPVEKVKRLTLLGFKQAKQVEETAQIIKKVELSEEIAQLVRKYKREYPLHKFITEEQVKQICHKYNLVCGDVSKYKGFVPEKNLKEIEKFKKRYNIEKQILVTKMSEKFTDIINLSDYKFCENSDYVYYKHIETGRHCFQQNKTVDNDGIHYYGNYINSKGEYIERCRMEVIGLQICAPVKDMDMTGMTLDSGYKMKKIHVPDPVVLQPISGGYLILSAWGAEASDPLVLNEINN